MLLSPVKKNSGKYVWNCEKTVFATKYMDRKIDMYYILC